MKRCVVLFGTDPITEAMARGAFRDKGIEVIVPARKEYLKPLGSFAGEPWNLPAPDYQGPFPEPVVLLCHLERELDGVLARLGTIRLGKGVLKAVLTEHNRCWNAVMLLGELQKERNAIEP